MASSEQTAVPNELLRSFALERVLDQDPRARTASLLGQLEGEQVVLLLEKTHFSEAFLQQPTFASLSSLGANDVYNWLLGWQPDGGDPHVKMTLIRPATQAHIEKYTAQKRFMVTESPEVYASVVEPWLKAQPLARIQWVYNILEKKKEAESILYEDADSESGFIVVPDLKWDRRTLSSLYLVAIVHNRALRSLRDLTKEHVGLLRKIQRQALQVAQDKFGLAQGGLRCFLHYQPTYYHLHVHILAADYTSHPGAIVGGAHLLDDVIDLLQLGVDFRSRTLTYSLGERSELLGVLRQAGHV
ncbi:scavenger mRNA decapping enzyme [Tilletiopsis washingtonensis]|uniref:m7GpppX diphosphatase n=1 Tax=Tilletiopsis washingtonensis TaxID=58919 RepID=A0A316Z910_9BASI|nr:scavenger mRNA decapping enzyme [Tilletiopsis washingtonensis]PWN96653.1 scavenger mRNA decapping enzyme [Tilletiopsis washingtonensis]